MEFVANFELNNNNLDASFDLSEGASFDALFEIYASGTTWGSIDGDIANQTDLYNILMSKADKTTVEADLEAINDTIAENYETLDNKIDSVQSDLSGDISALSQTVINNNTAINNRVDNIVESFDGDIEQINSNISDLQTTVSDNYSELNTKIQNEAAARAENDSLLQGDIDTLSDNLTAEISNRESADSGLQTQITNLTGTVSSNYNILNNSISNLSNTVDDLSDTVDSNYNILDTKINTTQTTLQGNIDTLSGTVTSNYNDLTQSITNNVSTLNTRITNEVSTLNGAISNEATTRANADNNLQTQIDAIVSSSDVFDIVGTYAELQAYDISTVPVNDIIKVLVDSTHNNAATYYRCVENAGVKSWSYIGSEGAYYTKGEADSTFVPQTRTINNKALNQNINLTASDVGALPVGTQIGNGTILLTQGGIQKGTFTLNQTGNATIDFDAVSEDITVDSELSTTSTNPVQNKVITGALDDKQDTLDAGDNIEIKPATIMRVPSGYTQLTSIYSSGGAGIDTGLSGNIQWEITAVGDAPYPTTRFLVSCANATGNSSWFGEQGYMWGYGSTNSTGIGVRNKATITIDFNTNSCNITINESQFSSSLASASAGNWHLFCSPSGSYYFWGEMFSAIARQGGVIVFDGVPAIRDSDDEVGLYDMVSGNFFPSVTATSFTVGEVAYPNPIISADVGDATISLTQYAVTKGSFNVNAKANQSISLNPTIATKEVNITPLQNSDTQKAVNSLLYLGSDDRIHSYTETNIPISLGYGMFVNSVTVSANSSFTWYYKGEKLSWTVPAALRNFTARQKVYAKCTYPDSNGNVYFVGVVGQANTTNTLEGGYTYYYLGNASSGTTTVALNVSGSHFISLDTDGNLTHIDGVEVAQPDVTQPNNGTLTITQDGNTLGTFGANQSTDTTINTKGLYDYYTPNVVVIGSPIITGNVMSGFSTSNYARIGSTINSNNQPWEYFIKFTVNTIPSASAYIIGGDSGLTNGIYLYLTNNNKLGINIGSSGTSFGTISANTTYKARIIVGADNNYNESLNVTNVYLYDENDNLLSSTQRSATWYNNIQSVFGVSNQASPSDAFDGSIDFGETYINFLSNGTATRVWNGAEPTIDTKADTDLNNITDSAKVMISGLGMPSDTYTDLTLGASGSTYTAPADGYFVLLMNTVNNTNMVVGLAAGVGRVGFTTVIPANNNLQSNNFGSFIPVKKGDAASVFYSGVTSAFRFRFVYAVGSESEAS